MSNLRSAIILACPTRSMIETVPLSRAAEAYARMMRGDARFRMVLTTALHQRRQQTPLSARSRPWWQALPPAGLCPTADIWVSRLRPTSTVVWPRQLDRDGHAAEMIVDCGCVDAVPRCASR